MMYTPDRGRGYLADTRAPRYSFFFVIPLVVAYELLATALSDATGGVRNGADVMLRTALYTLLGSQGPRLFGVLLAIGLAYLAIRDARSSGASIRPRYFVFMLAEAMFLAACFGILVGTVTARLLAPLGLLSSGLGADLHAVSTALPADMAMMESFQGIKTLSSPEKLMLSLGAGVYEELLFRVILVSLLTFAFRTVAGWSKGSAGLAAVILSAVIFSLFHYVGPMGDTLETPSFVFRMIGGVAFSALYVWRGFGVTAWTHALYDIYLLF
jgi:hypothetical protein